MTYQELQAMTFDTFIIRLKVRFRHRFFDDFFLMLFKSDHSLTRRLRLKASKAETDGASQAGMRKEGKEREEGV